VVLHLAVFLQKQNQRRHLPGITQLFLSEKNLNFFLLPQERQKGGS
jgi:hypothetical protein